MTELNEPRIIVWFKFMLLMPFALIMVCGEWLLDKIKGEVRK